jgi:alkylation response protein AidB-like acyl-CoA dehydrogenase
MDFDFADTQQAFRRDVRSWLAEHVPADLRGRGFAASRGEREHVTRLRAWQRRLYGAGYVGMDWPIEYGGRGASIVEQIIFYEEMSRAEAPQPLNRSGLSMLGPTIMRHGTPAQRERHLAKILTAEEIWCQVATEVIGPYSQIAAGSKWAPDEGQWQFYALLARGSGIRAGTSEILRNILGERVLGLPKD